MSFIHDLYSSTVLYRDYYKIIMYKRYIREDIATAFVLIETYCTHSNPLSSWADNSAGSCHWYDGTA